MSTQLSTQQYEMELRTIRSRLVEAVRQHDDAPGWVSMRPASNGIPSLTANRHLYGGQVGIAAFLAAHGAYTGEYCDRELIKRILRPWMMCPREELLKDDPGGFVGVGSLIYGFEMIGRYIEINSYRDRARELADAVSEDTISDRKHDIVFGNAGLLAALLALPETALPEALTIEIGDQLLDAQVSEGAGAGGWPTTEAKPTTGFAHGAAGIAYSLARLYDRTQLERFRQAVVDAVAFELDARGADGWQFGAHPEMTEQRVGWCWGSAGIGLSRVGMADYIDIEQIHADIHFAAETTCSSELVSDCLCHGTASKLAFLTAAGQTISETYREQAQELVASMIERRQSNGEYALIHEDYDPVLRPSLLLGKAGIGYSLLRLLEPERFEAICLLE